MNVENHNLAVRIYDALNAKGAGLGNVSIGIIERVINEGTCACGKKPQEHLSKMILTTHHYSYSHYGYVAGCSYCDELKAES